MKSMKFLSLSLLVVSFAGSVFASNVADEDQQQQQQPINNNNNQQQGGSTILPQEGDSKNLGNPRNPDEQSLVSDSYFSQAYNGIKNTDLSITKGKVAGGVVVVGLVGSVVAYKYNETFRNLVDDGVVTVKGKVEEIKKDNTKKAIAGGVVVGTLGLVAANHKYDLVSKAKGLVSSSDQII